MLFTSRWNGFGNFIGKERFACGGEVNGAVGELIGRDDVPQVEVVPAVCGGAFGEQAAVFVVCPARVEEIIADVAVCSAADEHRFVDQKGRGSGSIHERIEDFEGERPAQFGGLGETVIFDAGVEVGLGAFVVLGVDLVYAGGCPQRAIELQTDEVGNRPPAAQEGLLPFRWLGQRWIVGRQG